MNKYHIDNGNLALSIIECIAKHNLTVKQLKQIFRLLHTKEDHRAEYAVPIVEMLNQLYAAADHDRPDQSYLLAPANSGIQLVSHVAGAKSGKLEGLLHFPTGGFTLSMWFNVRSLNADWIMDGSR